MKIELIEGGVAPQRMTDGAVGYDCFAREVELHYPVKPEWAIAEGWVAKPKSATIKLGFKVDTSDPFNSLNIVNSYKENYKSEIGYGAFLFPRSGWAKKYGFKLKNTVGVIDTDYRGEVIAEVEFDECPPELLELTLQRVCQMVFLPCYVGELIQVDKLDETERGEGGFGSTNE